MNRLLGSVLRSFFDQGLEVAEAGGGVGLEEDGAAHTDDIGSSLCNLNDVALFYASVNAYLHIGADSAEFGDFVQDFRYELAAIEAGDYGEEEDAINLAGKGKNGGDGCFRIDG